MHQVVILTAEEDGSVLFNEDLGSFSEAKSIGISLEPQVRQRARDTRQRFQSANSSSDNHTLLSLVEQTVSTPKESQAQEGIQLAQEVSNCASTPFIIVIVLGVLFQVTIFSHLYTQD